MARLVAGAVLAAACAQSAPAQSLFFTDSLAGPSSPNLSIPAGEFSYQDGGLKRTGSSATTGHDGTDRQYVTTALGTYLTANFIFELSVQTQSSDLIYIGFGTAEKNPSYFNEATNSFIFRIHNVIWNGIHGAAPSGLSTPVWTAANIADLATYSSGETLRVRIERNGNNVTLTAKGGSRTFSVSQIPALNSGNGYLFFGNTTNGAVFTNFSVTPIVTYSWSASGFGACSLPCGGGTQTQTVTCTGSDGSTDLSGANCAGQTAPPSSQSCNTQPCPVDCVVSSAGFGPCSVSCGGGTQTELLTIVTPSANGGAACREPLVQSCNTHSCDTDGDGVVDTSDSCPGTASGSKVDASGCSGAQLVANACPTSGSYKNHGAYVSCVAKASEAALNAGLLTSAEKDAIVSAAAQSDIGKK